MIPTVAPLARVPSEQGYADAQAPVLDTNVMPGIAGSFTMTFAAEAGPRFVTVTVKVTFWPGMAVAGPVLETDTSAAPGATLVVAAELLFVELESDVDELTVAVLVTVGEACDAGTLKVEVMVFVPPATTVPSVQGNAVVQSPLLETKLRPDESGSATLTANASDGPALLTVMV